jgi:hypothetical protein
MWSRRTGVENLLSLQYWKHYKDAVMGQISPMIAMSDQSSQKAAGPIYGNEKKLSDRLLDVRAKEPVLLAVTSLSTH